MSIPKRPTECNGYYGKHSADAYMDALEAELRGMNETACELSRERDYARYQLAERDAEIARLRKALEKIVGMGWGISDTGVYGVARAALEAHDE